MTPQQVLILHQRTDDGGCLCEVRGSRRHIDPQLLGRSHAQHVLDQLAAAGYVVVPKRTLPVALL